MPDADNVTDVLDKAYKPSFRMLVAIIAAVATILIGLSSAEKFVDGRIDLRLADQKRQQEEQGKRIEQIEAQFSLMRDTLSEIRADVRVLRARFEK